MLSGLQSLLMALLAVPHHVDVVVEFLDLVIPIYVHELVEALVSLSLVAPQG